MASQTTNLHLTLPTGTENVSRTVINNNMTAIDTAVGAIPNGKTLQGQIDEVNGKIPTIVLISDNKYRIQF
jgi:hypothetical protein